MSDRYSPPEATQQDFTAASTVDELVKAAYFVATGIDAPTVEAVSPNQLNLHYPADGSLVSVRIEGRPGVWGGIGPHGTPEEETARNAHYDEMKAAAAPPLARREEEASDYQQEREHPVYEVQRQ